MRLSVLLLVTPLAWFGCTRENASPVSQDAGVLPIVEDGSMAACTSVGGTCVPFSNPTCPPEQQDETLCENTILLCCLPAAALEDGGGSAVTLDGSVTLDGTVTLDAGTTLDAGMTLDATAIPDASIADQQAPPTMDTSLEEDDAGD